MWLTLYLLDGTDPEWTHYLISYFLTMLQSGFFVFSLIIFKLLLLKSAVNSNGYIF